MFIRILIASIIITLTGCSTASGAIKGLGEDVKGGADSVSNWIKPEQGNKK
jgi:hypothetical protein